MITRYGIWSSSRPVPIVSISLVGTSRSSTPPVISSAEAERHAERPERDDQRRDARLGDQQAVQQAPGRARPASATARPTRITPPAVAAHRVHGLGGDDAGEDEHRADREVDPGGDDHERDARRRARAAPPRRWRCCGRSRRRRTASGRSSVNDDDEPDQDQRRSTSWSRRRAARQPARRRAPAAPRPGVGSALMRSPPRERAGRRSSRRRCPPSRRPAALSRATRRPSRRTSMRSATSKTSGMLWLIRTTTRPLVAHPPDQLEHVARLHDAERGRRLVHEHDLARPGHRAADRDALALAAGQRSRPARSCPGCRRRGAEGLVARGAASPSCRGSRACRAARAA